MTHDNMTATTASSYDKEANDQRSLARVGVKGVCLKKYEEAVADLLPHVTPCFSQLPPTPSPVTNEWPFDILPPAARVTGREPGKLKGARAVRKEGQLRSLLQCIVAMLPSDKRTAATIVDFCGGTGHLALPLALLLSRVKVVVVDIGSRSLQLLHEKALRCGQDDNEITTIEDSCMKDAVEQQAQDVTYQEQIERQCSGIPNLFTFHGSIETYPEKFDIGVALHACGEASDITLRACARVGANFVVCPCCVGKLNRQRLNPYIYHATAGNTPTITYPQSSLVQSCLENYDLWDDLVKAADYNDMQQTRTPRNATRRTAKALLETDRLLYMKEEYGYHTALTRMDPWESSCKNDILLGWLDDSIGADACVSSPYHDCIMTPDEECNADIELSKQHLLEKSKEQHYCDWTQQEEERVRSELLAFIEGDERKLIFSPGGGARMRRLLHWAAEEMKLAHWGHGKKTSEKTVIVAKKRAQGTSSSS